MKRFSFRLEPVLAYRKLIEDGEEYKLRSIDAAILDKQRTRDGIGLKIEHCGQALKERSHGTIDIEEIRNLCAYRERLREQLALTLRALTKLEQQRTSQLASLLEARKDREVVEKLKEDSLSDYRKEVRVLEQKMLDELSVTQFGRLSEQNLPTDTHPTRKD